MLKDAWNMKWETCEGVSEGKWEGNIIVSSSSREIPHPLGGLLLVVLG